MRTRREIFIDLLKGYEEASASVIGEMSGHVDRDVKIMHTKCKLLKNEYDEAER